MNANILGHATVCRDAQSLHLTASEVQITEVLGALLASCTAAAVKGAPGPCSTDAACAGSDSGGDEVSVPGCERPSLTTQRSYHIGSATSIVPF